MTIIIRCHKLQSHVLNLFLQNISILNQAEIDKFLCDLDGTKDKSRISAYIPLIKMKINKILLSNWLVFQFILYQIGLENNLFESAEPYVLCFFRPPGSQRHPGRVPRSREGSRAWTGEKKNGNFSKIHLDYFFQNPYGLFFQNLIG